MLSGKKKSKLKKRSIGFTDGRSGSVSNVENRVVMLCEDIASEASSWDSGRGSNSSGTRSSGDELGHGWRSRSFHGKDGQSTSSSTRPTKQYSVQEVRHVEASPVYGQNAGCSTLRIRELYESAALCTHHIYLLIIRVGTAGRFVAHMNLEMHLKLL